MHTHGRSVENLTRINFDFFQTTNYDFTASPSFIVTIMVGSTVRNNQMWFEIISYELKKKMFPAGLEPATFRVLGGRDNHYTTGTQTQVRVSI